MIKLDNNFIIDSDNYQWILRYESDPFEKEIKGEVKQITSKDTWYYPNIKSCLNRYVNESLKDCDSLITVLDRIAAIGDIINNIKELKR